MLFFGEGYFTLALRVRTVDANTQRPVSITIFDSYSHEMISRMSDREILKLFVHLADKWEVHERMEWLKLDGVCIDDPHPEQLATSQEQRTPADRSSAVQAGTGQASSSGKAG
jgi:hypothetical protein